VHFGKTAAVALVELYLIATFGAAAIGQAAWRRRDATFTARGLALAMVGCAEWAPSPQGAISRTVSVGVASLSGLVHGGAPATPAALMQAADEALYAAKAAGRDRVVLAGSDHAGARHS
jgi:GGDEF domain-containing protein